LALVVQFRKNIGRSDFRVAGQGSVGIWGIELASAVAWAPVAFARTDTETYRGQRAAAATFDIVDSAPDLDYSSSGNYSTGYSWPV